MKKLQSAAKSVKCKLTPEFIRYATDGTNYVDNVIEDEVLYCGQILCKEFPNMKYWSFGEDEETAERVGSYYIVTDSKEGVLYVQIVRDRIYDITDEVDDYLRDAAEYSDDEDEYEESLKKHKCKKSTCKIKEELKESTTVDFLKYQGKPYTTIFRELLTQENGGIKPPYHAQNYNNGAYNVLVWYIPEKDYVSEYASMFERAAQSIRSTGARCDIVVKPGYSNNRWGDDASHAVWVYTNRGVMEEPSFNAVKTDVRVPSPFDKHFRIKTNITDKPFSVPGYSEKVIAWLSPISRAAKEFLDSMTINGRACLTDAEDFPICTYEKGWNRRNGGLYPVSVEDLENIETAQL